MGFVCMLLTLNTPNAVSISLTHCRVASFRAEYGQLFISDADFRIKRIALRDF